MDQPELLHKDHKDLVDNQVMDYQDLLEHQHKVLVDLVVLKVEEGHKVIKDQQHLKVSRVSKDQLRLQEVLVTKGPQETKVSRVILDQLVRKDLVDKRVLKETHLKVIRDHKVIHQKDQKEMLGLRLRVTKVLKV